MDGRIFIPGFKTSSVIASGAKQSSLNLQGKFSDELLRLRPHPWMTGGRMEKCLESFFQDPGQLLCIQWDRVAFEAA
jgi:hypothetical protein